MENVKKIEVGIEVDLDENNIIDVNDSEIEDYLKKAMFRELEKHMEIQTEPCNYDNMTKEFYIQMVLIKDNRLIRMLESESEKLKELLYITEKDYTKFLHLENEVIYYKKREEFLTNQIYKANKLLRNKDSVTISKNAYINLKEINKKYNDIKYITCSEENE